MGFVFCGVKTCGPLQQLNREWHVAISRSSLIPEMLLELPINVKRVCRLLGYKVVKRRVERLRVAASKDLMLLDEEEFNKVIILQLALTHVRKSRQRHIITGREIVEWLLLSYSERTLDQKPRAIIACDWPLVSKAACVRWRCE